MAWDRDKERKAGKAMSLAGCIYAVVFMVVWNLAVVWMQAWIMVIFGLFGLGFAIARLVICIRMMNEKNTQRKETDPWDRPVQKDHSIPSESSASGCSFCPYCGEPMQEGFSYCPKCGRKQG